MRIGFIKAYLIACLAICWETGMAQWEAKTYPDESGFKKRMAPMLQRIAAKGFGKRSLAVSKCPDTGLPVKVWALEGETIISPYTGRAYIQGPTGYFGPKQRNEQGEIVAFGGDPLKHDLPPALAALLLDTNDPNARSFLSIPGNMRQQYHFASKNWARMYPLLYDEMGEEWREKFYYWVAAYSESRRPSDGNRQHLSLSMPHNLVGEVGKLLGGNTLDGGTENHKTMWRTSALLYSQLFPETAQISGYPVKEAQNLTTEMIRDYLKRILQTGNGEYDSQVYYPHSIEAFLNLYDFSPDKKTRQLAKMALDYYFVTYGLKVIDGTVAGAQKRGYLADVISNEMEDMQWGFFNNTSRNMDNAVVTIQQATTSYRPNKVIWNITNKQLDLPFEASMSRPFYHMDRPHAFAETYFCSESYAMGNIQMTIVDNPNQQMVWSLVAKGTNGPLCFSGGHPMRGSTSGHSPYTQTLQAGGALILITAPTLKTNTDTLLAPNYTQKGRPNLWHLPRGEQGLNFELRNRQKYATKPLHEITPPKEESPEEIARFWQESKGSASSWFYFPKELQPQLIDGIYYFEANQTWVAVKPLTSEHSVVNINRELADNLAPKSGGRFFKRYGIIALTGQVSGYVVESAEKKEYKNLEAFVAAINDKTVLDISGLKSNYEIDYTNLRGDKVNMIYQPAGLRCKATINGKEQDWDNHTKGAVYESPYVKIKNGVMEINDGVDGYRVDFKGDWPRWRKTKF